MTQSIEVALLDHGLDSSELKEIMASLQDMDKSVGNHGPVASPTQKAIEDTVETLNNLKGFEMDSLFYYTATFMLFDPNKSVPFLRCHPKHVPDGWLI